MKEKKTSTFPTKFKTTSNQKPLQWFRHFYFTNRDVPPMSFPNSYLWGAAESLANHDHDCFKPLEPKLFSFESFFWPNHDISPTEISPK